MQLKQVKRLEQLLASFLSEYQNEFIKSGYSIELDEFSVSVLCRITQKVEIKYV